MSSNTGLFVTQPLGFGEFENQDDLLSYAPISDLLLSSEELYSEDAYTQEQFQPKSFDIFGGDFQNTSFGLDTTSLDTTSWKNFELESPLDSADWLQSPGSSSSVSSFSLLDASSNNSSMSYIDDSHIDLKEKANELNFQNPLSHRFASSPSPDLLQDEVAKLWTMAFPCESPAQTPQAAVSPNIESSPPPARRQYKRKSKSPPPTSANDSAPAYKKRSVEEKAPKRSYQRRNTLTSESSSGAKGSKLNHNLIEKRYRCSLNDKIVLLREAMPKNYGNNCASDDEDDVFVKREDGAETEARQTTKGAILSNAARYIRSLEGKVNKLERELSSDE